MKNPVSYIILIFGFILSSACSITNPPVKPDMTFSDTIFTNISGKGLNLIINFEKGRVHNHPTFVFWAEDMNENYIQTLFVTKSFATGIFGHAPLNDSLWSTKPGITKRPAALPYWWHKCNVSQSDVPSPDKPFVDGYTGATPAGSFIIKAKTDKKTGRYVEKGRIPMLRKAIASARVKQIKRKGWKKSLYEVE